MAAYRYQHGDRPLDGYTIEHGLGRGGFGEVYYAVSDAGRQVALKAVQNYQEIELRGIRRCMNLKSPYLVTIFDVKHNERDEPFVIMEYVSGPSLRQVVDESPEGLGTTKAAFFLREIAKGLSYLHDCGVVHRDLKPHNVFYEEGFVKIGDYSLSKLISSSHRSGHTTSVGTVHYMAPEISQGRYDSRVDIYALGIMLYEMLTGQPPFVGESMGEILMKHLTVEPDLNQIEEPFRSAVARALAKNPDERFQTAQEMSEAVFGAQHVHNSVTDFDPQELSVVAARVAEKALVTAGGGSSGPGYLHMSPGFAETEAVIPASVAPGHDAAESNSVVAALDSAHAAAGDACWQFAEKMGLSPAPVATNELTDCDPLPLDRRLRLGVASALSFGLGTSILSNSHPFTVFWAVFVAICLVTVAADFARRRLVTRVDPNKRMLSRLVIGGTCFLAMVVWSGVIAGLGRSPEIANTIKWAIVPMFLLDWRRLTAPGRLRRMSLSPVLLAAVIAAFVPFRDGKDIVLAAGMAAGIALTLQVVSAHNPRSMARRRRTHSKDNEVGDGPPRVQPSPYKSTEQEARVQPLDAARVVSANEPQDISPHSRLALFGLALLYFFTGIGGLHRFYVGKTVSGVIWLVTGGMLFIGQMIDLILIVSGNFRDAEGRRVIAWDNPPKPAATPVNHLSAVPAATPSTSGRTWRSQGLAALGGAFLLLSILTVAVPLTSVVVAAGALDAADVEIGEVRISSQGLARSFGAPSWPRTVQSLATIVASGFALVGVGLLVFGRRVDGLGHVFRSILGGLMLVLAFSLTLIGMRNVSWDQVHAHAEAHQHVLAIENGLFHGAVLPLVCTAAVMFLVSLFILAWPARRQEMTTIAQAGGN